MELDTKIANLAREINKNISDYATLEMRRIKNAYITERGEVKTVILSDEIESQVQETKEILNENLFELDQAIGERDCLMKEGGDL